MAQSRQQMRQQQRRQPPPQPQPPKQQNAVAVIEGTANEIQTLPLDRALDVYGPNFAELLPPNVTVGAFKRMVITAVNTNPELASGDRRTLFNECSKAAHDGLMPDGNEAALVLFRGTKIKNRYGQEERIDAVKYMPMVNGIKKRLWNSGFVAAIDARAIYKNDKTRWIEGSGERVFEHIPAPLDQEPGPIIGAWAKISLVNGHHLFDVMRKADIEKSRAQSRTPGSFMWEKFYDQAACKTVLRRCAKGAPQAALLQEILDRDDQDPALGDGRALAPPTERPKAQDYISVSADPTAATKTQSPPPEPEPEPTVDIADSEGEIVEHPRSRAVDVLIDLLDAARKRPDQKEARRAVETIALNNQETIIAMRGTDDAPGWDKAGADRVIARYQELTAELDPFGLPGTAGKDSRAEESGKNAQAAASGGATGPEAGAAGGDSPKSTTTAQGRLLPALERFPNGAPNWPKWCADVIALIRRAGDRGRLAAINGAINPFRNSAPPSVLQDIAVALDDRSHEL